MLGLVGVGDEAAIDHRRGAGDVGQRAGDEPAGAGFRRRHHELLRLAQIEQGGRGGFGSPSVIAIYQDQGRRTVAVAIAAMPSLRPVKPSCSLVVAFTATRSIDISAISAIRFRIASRCGPMRGASQTMVTIEMRDPAAALGHALDREFQELVGRRAAPARIVGREMLADVAVGERAEDRVDQRMQRDVGVRMAGQPAVVRNLDAAEPDMIAVAEGVHVEAVAETQVRQARDPPRLGLGEILVGGELHVAAFSRETLRP